MPSLSRSRESLAHNVRVPNQRQKEQRAIARSPLFRGRKPTEITWKAGRDFGATLAVSSVLWVGREWSLLIYRYGAEPYRAWYTILVIGDRRIDCERRGHGAESFAEAKALAGLAFNSVRRALTKDGD